MPNVESKTMQVIAWFIMVTALIVSVGQNFFGIRITEAMWHGGFLLLMVAIVFLENTPIFKEFDAKHPGNIMVVAVNLAVLAYALSLLVSYVKLPAILIGATSILELLEAMTVVVSLYT